MGPPANQTPILVRVPIPAVPLGGRGELVIARSNELGGNPLPLSRPDELVFFTTVTYYCWVLLSRELALVACRCRCPGRVSEPLAFAATI